MFGGGMKFLNPSSGVKPVGHYSTAVLLPNGFLFLSGQISIDNEGTIVGSTIREQTRIILSNIKNVLNELSYDVTDIFKVVVYIRDISKFGEFNEVYKEFFGEHKPVRTTVEVSNLPKGALIEIEVSAFKG
jgi:2-iminobutanoate/2-iminopropanoate deaminase